MYSSHNIVCMHASDCIIVSAIFFPNRAGVLLAFFSNEKSYTVVSDVLNDTVVTGAEYVEDCVEVSIIQLRVVSVRCIHHCTCIVTRSSMNVCLCKVIISNL